MDVNDILTPSVEDPNQALMCTGPSAPRIPYFIATSDTVMVLLVKIVLLSLVHPLLVLPFPPLTKTWHLLAVRVKLLGLITKVGHSWNVSGRTQICRLR